ncbi:MAG: hypothetical protein QNJ30_13020 [Kiloniellales bacterium]|nr:hypothetical protein [Kiloniellales bacterium]
MVMRQASQPDPRDRAATETGGWFTSRSADRDTAAAKFVPPSLEAIDIALQPAPDGWQPHITYRRPDIGGLLSGLPLSVAREQLGRIHTACGYAHETAFTRAVESAFGTSTESAARYAARELHLLIEAAIAYARRAALELAPACGEEPCVAQLKAVLAAAGAAKATIGLDHLDEEIVPDRQPLAVAIGRLCDEQARLLQAVPAEPPGVIIDRLPTPLRNLAREGWRRPWRFFRTIGSTARGLVDRLDQEPTRPFCPSSNTAGSGSATTSRGRLRYVVRSKQGRLVSLRASTPTKRLVAPGGALARQLSLLPLANDVADLARFVVLAADPCAPATIRVSEAAHA